MNNGGVSFGPELSGNDKRYSHAPGVFAAAELPSPWRGKFLIHPLGGYGQVRLSIGSPVRTEGGQSAGADPRRAAARLFWLRLAERPAPPVHAPLLRLAADPAHARLHSRLPRRPSGKPDVRSGPASEGRHRQPYVPPGLLAQELRGLAADAGGQDGGLQRGERNGRRAGAARFSRRGLGKSNDMFFRKPVRAPEGTPLPPPAPPPAADWPLAPSFRTPD